MTLTLNLIGTKYRYFNFVTLSSFETQVRLLRCDLLSVSLCKAKFTYFWSLTGMSDICFNVKFTLTATKREREREIKKKRKMVGLTVCGLPSLGEVARIGEQPRGNGTAQTLYRGSHEAPISPLLLPSDTQRVERTNRTERTSKKNHVFEMQDARKSQDASSFGWQIDLSKFLYLVCRCDRFDRANSVSSEVWQRMGKKKFVTNDQHTRYVSSCKRFPRISTRMTRESAFLNVLIACLLLVMDY